MKSLAAAFLLSTLCVRIFAASPASSPSAIVDKLVERDMHRYGIVGVSVGVRSGDAVVHEKAYGLANIELAVAARPDTVYQLSSTTKIMTGTALLALFTAKGLSLDSPAASFLPELPETWRTVTVRQLVSHLSGLPDVTEIDVTSAEEAITILGSKPVEAPPGERWRYNQTNYMLVRRIIERLSGTTFENYVAEKIFRPAGMRSSVFAGSLFDVVAGRATSYQGENGVLRLRDFRFPRYNSGAAGLNSNVPDLLRFDAALRAGRILPAEAVALLWQPARLANGSETHYGLGWSIERVPGHRSAGHEGGGNTTVRRFIDDDITVVLLTNGSLDRWDVEDLTERIAAAWKPAIRSAQDRLSDRIHELLDDGSSDAAEREYRAWQTDPANRSFSSEGAINRLGYTLLRRRRITQAVMVFRWNTERYPQSANAYDSLGDALIAAEDTAAARAAYERALELDPTMESSRKALSKIQPK